MKNVLIISSSPRRDGNSEVLCQQFAKGAMDGGNNVNVVYLSAVNMNFCRGCYYCYDNGECIQRDDMNDLNAMIRTADVLVLATPVYFYQISGQLKTFLDRMLPIYYRDYNFHDVYFIATCADTNSDTVDRALQGISGWLECFDKVTLAGIIYGLGVTDVGDILGSEVYDMAYQMGVGV
ncbi:MAG: flavodoxin family protein [Clostridia bacterium]|nr:flavodoxin family protein [Clostridia bacterium]